MPRQRGVHDIPARRHRTEADGRGMLRLDVHFVNPAPVSSPGSAGLQPGSRSHAGAWRSQGKPWRTGSGFMKQTSSEKAPPAKLAGLFPCAALTLGLQPLDIEKLPRNIN